MDGLPRDAEAYLRVVGLSITGKRKNAENLEIGREALRVAIREKKGA